MAKFSQSFFSQKAVCKLFLREFGIARDWERVKLSDMQAMLKHMPDDKLFKAAKTIMERDGLPYNEADYIDRFVDAAPLPEDEDEDEDIGLPEQVAEPEIVQDEQFKADAEAAEREAIYQHNMQLAVNERKAKEVPFQTPKLETPKMIDANQDQDVAELAAQLAAAFVKNAKPKAPEIDAVAIHKIATAAANTVVTERTTAMVDGLKKQLTEIANIAANNVAPREIHIKNGDNEVVKIDGLVHPVFEKVMRLARAGINVMLVGPAGCGKTHLAAQVAKALGKSFASISGSAGVSEAQITGRLLPTGDGGKFEYHESPFVREYSKENGAFLFDEMDAFDANCLLTVNQATANDGFEVEARGVSGLGTFVARGSGALLMGSCNTFGTGADMQYVGRSQLDGATLDRWYIVRMDYNAALEAKLSGMPSPVMPVWRPAAAPSAEEIVSIGEWVTDLRRRVNESKLRRIVSTRMLQKAIAARQAGVKFNEIKVDLTAGWSKDELTKVGM